MTATERLHEMSMLDPLTGICNRRQFEEDFQRIWLDSLYSGKPLAMLIIDVDFFKLFNDGYGHPMGDRCLKQVAAAISQTAQEGLGLTARLGGEEFGILLPGANAKQATELGERVCAAVRNAAIEHRFSQVPGHPNVTVSVGAASVVAQKRVNRRTLFAMADDALYQAKHAGRNRVATLTGPVPSPLQMAGAA
ncbi:GGDEF domain-containing protein [Aquabacterium sp.]|uniref:GGDEF domain-containing protein n=1 Tax=Aquabacterium sp. TaxID=1872578 RepID=UPI00198D6CA0|nr:GGDEF domain-containing protein [Aquabacterium sp.]MBC7700111.1 GGDEF domain-containing protein [Aquabacterium sp.]